MDSATSIKDSGKGLAQSGFVPITEIPRGILFLRFHRLSPKFKERYQSSGTNTRLKVLNHPTQVLLRTLSSPNINLHVGGATTIGHPPNNAGRYFPVNISNRHFGTDQDSTRRDARQLFIFTLKFSITIKGL